MEYTNYPRENTPTKTFDWLSAAQLIGSLLSALLLILAALLFFISGISMMIKPVAETLSVWLMIATSLTAGLLLLPSAWFALLRLLGRPAKRILPAKFPKRAVLMVLLLVVFPATLIAGSAIINLSGISWLLMPPLQIIAVATPILWILYLATSGLPSGSPQRTWGLFNSGLILAPFITIIVEISLGIMMVAGVMVFLLSQPGFIDQIGWLANQMEINPAISTEMVAETFLPYMQNPLVIYAALTFFAILVPLVEEAIKPVGVWLISGRKLTPAQGFTAGVISGAGFALMETLGYSSATVDNWLGITLARAGTGVMHITTTALVSWALASTWKDGRYARVFLTYLAAVLIHGVWNGLTVSLAALGMSINDLGGAIYLQIIGAGIMGLILLTLLLWFSARLRRQQNTEISPDENLYQRAIIPPPPADTSVAISHSIEENHEHGNSVSTD